MSQEAITIMRTYSHQLNNSINKRTVDDLSSVLRSDLYSTSQLPEMDKVRDYFTFVHNRSKKDCDWLVKSHLLPVISCLEKTYRNKNVFNVTQSRMDELDKIDPKIKMPKLDFYCERSLF